MTVAGPYVDRFRRFLEECPTKPDFRGECCAGTTAIWKYAGKCTQEDVFRFFRGFDPLYYNWEVLDRNGGVIDFGGLHMCGWSERVRYSTHGQIGLSWGHVRRPKRRRRRYPSGASEPVTAGARPAGTEAPR